MASYTEDSNGNLTLIIPDTVPGAGVDPPDSSGEIYPVIYNFDTEETGYSDGNTFTVIAIGGGGGAVSSVNSRTGAVTIQASDITNVWPKATTGAVGVVKVGSGLAIDGNGLLTATGGVSSGVDSFNARTGTVSLQQSDVTTVWPKATTSTLGVVSIGAGLSIDGAGELTTTGISTVNSVDTITDLLVAATTVNVNMLGYHSKNDGGGGEFYYDDTKNRNTHNGGTIIDPTRTFPSDWANETQKTTWFTASTGTGCWIRVGNNSSVDGRCFGVKFDNLATPITDNTKALQKAVDNAQTVWLPGGKYKVINLKIPDKMGLLALNSKIHLITTASYLMYVSGTGDVTGVEFHGILESTLTGNDGYSTGMIRVLDATGLITNWNIRGVEYITVGSAKGLFLVPSAQNGSRAWIKDIDARDSIFTCGDMGMESNNHDKDLIISSISIGANAVVTIDASAITNNATVPSLVEGQTICFVGIVGTGAVSKLNGKFFRVHVLSPTTFNIMLSDGSYYNTTGGTYTFTSSTGEDNVNSIYVYRLERLDLSGSVFNAAGTYSATPPPTPGTSNSMGISLSGPSINCNLSDTSYYNCVNSSIELVGASFTKVSNCLFYNCTGKLLAATNYRFGYSNTFNQLKTIGQDNYNGIEITRQYRMMFTENSLVLKNSVTFDMIKDCIISNCYIKTLTNVSAMTIGSNTSAYPTTNNFIFDCILDNSEQATVASPLAFAYPYSYKNIADRITINSPSALSTNINEWGGAADNVLINWRYPTTIGWEQSVANIVTTNGLVSTFGSEDISDSRKLIKRDFSGTGILFVLEQPDVNTGQPFITFNIEYAGRENNNSIGGTIQVQFGSYSNPTADPKFNYKGSGEDIVYSGTATLVAGSVTITDGRNKSTSNIVMRGITPGGTPGALYLYSKVDDNNFVIKSTSATDTSQIYWEIRTPTSKPSLTYSGLNGSSKHYWTMLFPTFTTLNFTLTATAAPSAQSAYSIGTI